MLCLCGFVLYSRWVPLIRELVEKICIKDQSIFPLREKWLLITLGT